MSANKPANYREYKNYLGDEFFAAWLDRSVIVGRRLSIPEAYVDMVGGNWYVAPLLAQIVYWSEVNQETLQPRMSFWFKDHLWIVKSYEEWAAECFMSERTARRSMKTLEHLSLIIKEVHLSPFHLDEEERPKRALFVRLNVAVFSRLMKAWLDKTQEFPKRRARFDETALEDVSETALEDVSQEMALEAASSFIDVAETTSTIYGDADAPRTSVWSGDPSEPEAAVEAVFSASGEHDGSKDTGTAKSKALPAWLQPRKIIPSRESVRAQRPKADTDLGDSRYVELDDDGDEVGGGVTSPLGQRILAMLREHRFKTSSFNKSQKRSLAKEVTFKTIENGRPGTRTVPSPDYHYEQEEAFRLWADGKILDKIMEAKNHYGGKPPSRDKIVETLRLGMADYYSLRETEKKFDPAPVPLANRRPNSSETL